MRCGIISSCQSAATSEIVKALMVVSLTHVRGIIASTQPLPLPSDRSRKFFMPKKTKWHKMVHKISFQIKILVFLSFFIWSLSFFKLGNDLNSSPSTNYNFYRISIRSHNYHNRKILTAASLQSPFDPNTEIHCTAAAELPPRSITHVSLRISTQ